MPNALTPEYRVSDTACSCCENTVQQEVPAHGAVANVQVNVPTDRVTVTSITPLDESQVHEAGYDSPAEDDSAPSHRKPGRFADYYGLA